MKGLGGKTVSERVSSSVQRVHRALLDHGLETEILELPQSTRSAKEAAQAVGCEVAQIAKSIVFKARETEKPVLVIASGPNRINEDRISSLVSEPVKMANPDFVKSKTGFSIGGVAPVGHLEKPEIFIDEDLFKYKEIWAAAGTPHAVFKLTPHELEKITGGRVISVK